MSTPEVKSYASGLRSVALSAGINGSADLAEAAGLTRESRRRAKSHWLGHARPARTDHVAYSAALRCAIRTKYGYADEKFWRLHDDVTELELKWSLAATKALRPAFIETDDRENVIPWPEFTKRWLAGDLEDTVSLRVGVDFSGYQSIDMGWVIPLKRVRRTRKPYRESLVVVEYGFRPRLASRAEYAPRDKRGAPPEMWLLYHDEMLWRVPKGRVIAVERDDVVPQDPDLKVLRIEKIERGALRILFICTN